MALVLNRSSLSGLPVGGAFLLAVVIFLISLICVYVGFTGYYSRVNLASDLQKQGKNIDVLFMQIDQLERDEVELRRLRQNYVIARGKDSDQSAALRQKLYASDDYNKYVSTIGVGTSILSGVRENLDSIFWSEILSLDVAYPDFSQIKRFLDPKFNPGTPDKLKVDIIKALAPVVIDLRLSIAGYEAQLSKTMSDGLTGSRNAYLLGSEISEIVRRNPQLALPEELEKFGSSGASPVNTATGSGSPKQATRLDASATNRSAELNDSRAIEQQRAVIRSYRNALGIGSVILQWPTIVSTLLVTMAAGCLGGVVSFFGATTTTGSGAGRQSGRFEDPRTYVLLRRVMLSVTAALGIFLFAGSGLLVLTAQSGKAVTEGSIELNPYFVAFLAFISGFLADDAFLRMATAGRSLFNSGNSRVRR